MQNVFRDIWELKLWNEYRQTHRKDVDPRDEVYLKTLDGYFEVYHSMKKSDFKMLEPRYNLLGMVYTVCNQFLTNQDTHKGSGRMEAKMGDPRNLLKTVPDPKSPTGFTQVKPQGESGKRKGFGTHTVYDNPMTHKVYSLMRRAKLKGDYLRALKQMYQDPESQKVGDPTAFVKAMVSPQPDASGFGLKLGVQMEFVDPAHRDFELGSTNHTGYLLDTWIKQVSAGKTNLPFFLWLEEDASSWRKGEARELGMGHVKYMTDEERASYLLTFSAGYVEGVKFGPKFKKDSHFNTTALTGDDPYWQGYAAFVVSTANEWFAFQHEPGLMHHSTPLSGGVVKAAGMIRVESGKVTAIGNKSGHYRPTPTSLLEPIRCLQNCNALSPNVKIHILDENTAKVGHPTVLDLQQFLQTYSFQTANKPVTPPKSAVLGVQRMQNAH